MPAKKGTRPPNCGKRGRKPGTPNRVTRTTRELFSAFVDHNAAKAQALFDRVARRNPAMALRILSSFAEFSLPRLQRTELDASVGLRTAAPEWDDDDPNDTRPVVTDPVEASHIYIQMIRGKIPLGSVRFGREQKAAIAYTEMVTAGRGGSPPSDEVIEKIFEPSSQGNPPPPSPPPARPALSPPPAPISRAEPILPHEAPTSAEPRPAAQDPAPADPAPSSMGEKTRELWERLGKPSSPEEALSALDAALRVARPPYIVT